MNTRIVMIVALSAAFVRGIAFGDTQFEERDGLVSMEAENATRISGWEEKTGMSGASGVTMIDNGQRGVDGLTFTITFNQAGTYMVWALTAKSTVGYESDQANDCFASFDGNHLEILGGSNCSGHTAEVIGLGTHQTSLGWQSRPKTECVDDRRRKVIFTVETPGTYDLEIISRSKGYMLDKFVVVHESLIEDMYRPNGLGPEETILGGTSVSQGFSGGGERSNVGPRAAPVSLNGRSVKAHRARRVTAYGRGSVLGFLITTRPHRAPAKEDR